MNRSLLILIMLCRVSFVHAQTAGDYRSHQTGSWSDVISWERYDGATWVSPAPTAPSSADNAITILAGHAIAVDAATTADQLVVSASGVLKVAASQTLTIADASDSIDAAISGTLDVFGTVVATGRISFESGGLFIFSVPGGGTTMPLCTWRSGSTCRIDSTTGSTPTNLNTQALHHLIINAANQAANGGPNFADGYILNGDLTVLNSKNVQWRVTNLSGGQTKNIFIRGNVNIAGATALLTSTGSGADTLAKAVITIDGSVNLSAGIWNLNNSSNVYAEWKVKGNVNITGGTLLSSGASGWAGRRKLTFNGTTQSMNVSAPGTIGTATAIFKVAAGAVVTVNFPWTITTASGFELESGKFITTPANLITLPAAGLVLGGNSSSYVDGPFRQTVASTSATVKSFPIGKGATYRPVVLTVNQDAATATTYTAELINGAPLSRTLPATLSAVSPVRYVSIAKGGGAGISPTLGATVQMSYGAGDPAGSATILRVAKDDGAGAWLNLGGSGTADTTGTITSNAFYSFSDFVLATADTGSSAVVPTVATTSVMDISTTFATSGGNVTNDGGAAVSARGVCWNTTGSPTIADPKTTDGTGAGNFASAVTGLAPGQTYHVRAYATNSAGTGYGGEEIFSTLSAVVPPTLATTAISNILVTSAISGGNVTAWGGASVTGRGVCWNTTGNPTISDAHSNDGSGLGSFVSGLAPLAGNTPYYVRAYATNSSGTGYGSELTFTTQTPAPDTTVVVAQDGSGNYLTVQAAFNSVPAGYTGKWTIVVRNGVYYEKLLLASGKINVNLIGQNRDSTILTYDDYADRFGSGNPGTSGSYSIAIDANDFTAKNITFRNTYSPQPGVVGTQAVALRTQGDRHEYVNCRILGYQDTYYTWGGSGTGRMYHKNCLIEGTVDFIFGRNIAVFDSCTIHVIRNTGTVTAGATDATSRFGYVFRNCSIVADSIGYDGNPITAFYLGRPWQASPRTVFIHCEEPWNLHPAGWQAWNVNPAIYGEYYCYGLGANPASRVGWSTQLGDSLAATYTLATIFARSSAVSNLILYDWYPLNAAGNNLPLPIQLASFTGRFLNQAVRLNWRTLSEVNNYGFYVERRRTGESVWIDLPDNFVAGNGTTTIPHDYSFTDNTVTPGVWVYRLKQVDLDGSTHFLDPIQVSAPTGVYGQIATEFSLLQNYPNPFNPETRIAFSVDKSSHTTLSLHNTLGQRVAMLFDEIARSGQYYTVKLMGGDLSSGVYFYRLQSGDRSALKKLILLK